MNSGSAPTTTMSSTTMATRSNPIVWWMSIACAIATLVPTPSVDVAGAVTGVVEADAVLGPDRVQAGDVLVAMASSGLHSNGYSLVRAVVKEAGWSLDRHVPELGRELGLELLEPTRLYARPCLDLVADAAAQVHAFSHVTGGGLAANLARVLPAGLLAEVDRGTWAAASATRSRHGRA